MPIQVSRQPELSTEANTDPVLNTRDTGKTCVVSVTAVTPQEDTAPERHEPPLPPQNMPPLQDRNTHPPETSMKVLMSLIQIS